MDFRRRDEIAMWWWRWRRPLQRRSLPRIIRSDLGALLHTPEKIHNKENLEETPFELSKESHEAISQLMKKYPDNYKASAVIPALFIAQKQNNNFLPLSAMNKVAKMLEMTPMQVYEVATFFTMFNRTRLGKYHLQVCGTTPCMLRGVSIRE